MYAKYQMLTAEAGLQVEFPMYALSKNTKSILKKKSEKIMLNSKCCHFVKKIFLSIQYLHVNVQGVCIVYAKYQILNSKSSATS